MNIQLELGEENQGIDISKLAASYARVSTEKQGKEGYSIKSQLEYAEKYAERNSWKLLNCFKFNEEKPATYVQGHDVDEYSIIESFADRPQLAEVLKRAQNKEFKHLIVYSRDRLSRVVQDIIVLELFFKRYEVEVHYVKEGDDFGSSSDKVKRLLHIIFTSLTEMEISLLSSRVKEGGKTCIKKGKWAGGKVPFGYVPLEIKNDLRSSKKKYTKLKISDFESKIVKRVYELYSLGHGYRSTAKIMNEEYGFIRWTKSKVEGIIKNQTYTGEMFWDRRGGRRDSRKHNGPITKSPFEPDNVIIEKGFWDETAKEMEERNLYKDSHYYDTDHFLRGKLICSKCKRTMKAKNPGRNQKRVYKCANNKEQRKECNTIIECFQVEKEFIQYMKKSIFNIDDTNKLWNIYSNDFDEKNRIYKEQTNEFVPRIEQSEKTVKSIDKLLAEKYKDSKKNKNIINVLETQHSIYYNLVQEYKRTKEMIEDRTRITKKTEDEFSSLVKDFIPALFVEINSKELNRLRREFIIKFIESIEVSYDKKTHKVNIDKIVFLPPELI